MVLHTTMLLLFLTTITGRARTTINSLLNTSIHIGVGATGTISAATKNRKVGEHNEQKKILAITAALAGVLFSLGITAAFALPTPAKAASAQCAPREVVAEKGEVVYAECGDTVIAEDGSGVTAKGDSTAIAKHGSKVTAMDGSIVKAYEGSYVIAENGSIVYAYKGSHVIAEARSIVHAYGLAHVIAYYDSEINAHDGATVRAKYGCLVVAHQGSIVHREPGAAVRQEPGSTVIDVDAEAVDTEDEVIPNDSRGAESPKIPNTDSKNN